MQEYRDLIDKSHCIKMDNAPWLTEPDLVVGTYRGYAWAILRREHWCNLNGYVNIPGIHPWCGKHYEECEGVNVHGGLTYAGAGTLGFTHSIAVPDGSPWWIGFDTAHSFDLTPGNTAMLDLLRSLGELPVYRDYSYVYAEILNLIRAVQDAAGGVEGPGIEPVVEPWVTV